MAAAPGSQISVEKKPEKLKVGDHYLVLRNKTWHSAEIIEVRKSKNKEHGDKYEYYVHYDGWDRRLDEWIDRDRIDVASANRSTGADQLDRTYSTRSQRRKFEEINHIQKISKVKYIELIQFGLWEIGTWYHSPYPAEYEKVTKLYICEFCLKYMRFAKSYLKHKDECTKRRPPGKEIYKKDALSVFEIDGKEHTLYCQCLCLLCKLFLDHKACFLDVEHFFFYVVTESNANGQHFVGYFSKEKLSCNNLSCILTLPPYQRKGFGMFLIAFSYELSKRENLVGSPEEPLSDLGRASYRSYWSWTILHTLKNHREALSIKEISQMTSIAQPDIINTLKEFNLVEYFRGEYIIRMNDKLLNKGLNHCRIPKLSVDLDKLVWIPPKKQIKPSKRC